MKRGLFLDPGGNIGWAVMPYHPILPPVELGTWPLASLAKDWGARLGKLDAWLDAKILETRVDHIGFEAPFQPTGFRSKPINPQLSRFLICVAGKIEEVAFRCAIGCSEVSIQSAKFALSGDGNATKEKMIAAAVNRGWRVASEHEADACAVGLHCINNDFLRRRA